MIIYTTMREGTGLDPAVIDGLAKNNCGLVPVTSTLPDRRANMHYCRTVAMEMCKTSVMVMMDSDIVLVPMAVKRITELMQKNDMVVWEADQGSRSHGLIALSQEIKKKVPFEFAGKNQCSVCPWIEKIEKKFRVYRISVPKLKQIKQEG